jgi:hypothetical protein
MMLAMALRPNTLKYPVFWGTPATISATVTTIQSHPHALFRLGAAGVSVARRVTVLATLGVNFTRAVVEPAGTACMIQPTPVVPPPHRRRRH